MRFLIFCINFTLLTISIFVQKGHTFTTTYMNTFQGGFTMKNKKTELENEKITSEFKLTGLIFAIADLIRALHEAGII